MTEPLVFARPRRREADTSTRSWRTSAHRARVGLAGLSLLLLAGCGGRVGGAGSANDPSLPPPSPGPGPGPGPAQVEPSVVLFGGLAATTNGGSSYFGDTWRWTESAGWIEQQPIASPPARFGAMAASSGSDVVLYGGVTEGDPSASGENDETWAWDGATWTEEYPTSPPPPLTTSVFAPFGQGLLLFGGYNDGIIYDDVWSLEGSTWSHLAPSATPSAREAPAGAVVGGSLVIFGGEDDQLLPLGDTWVFDGTTWTEMHPVHFPSPRRGATAAAFQGKLVLFGGDTLPPTYGDWFSVNETWVWDGADWTEMTPASTPDPRSFAGMAAAGEQLVLFGGGNFGGSFGEAAGTWTWDGSDWTKRPGPDPDPRNEPTLAPR